MMQDAIGRFQLTIAHLTDLSRLQLAHSELAEAVSLEATIEAVCLDLASELEATEAQLTVDVNDCPSILLAPHHLRSVIYNLLSNALKYRHPDRVPEMHLHCHTQADRSVLTVRDNGLGLTEVQQQKIFGLFRRLHAHVEGSGVGLYMVKRIVENAGGTIAVQSTPGVGSAFIVSLPTTLPPYLSSFQLNYSATYPYLVQKLLCVLLVDDDPTTNFLHEHLLLSLGVTDHCVVAEKGGEALDPLAEAGDAPPPVLVLLDVQPPAMLPVIVILSSSVHPHDQSRLATLPVDDWVSKPLTREKINTILVRHFQRQLPPNFSWRRKKMTY